MPRRLVLFRRHAPAGPPPDSDLGDSPRRVLVISASMGAGHDGAARELAERLSRLGHEAVVRDFLDCGPLRLGALLRAGYELELKHAPSAYDATYRLWYRVPWLCPIVAWLVTVLARRRLLAWVEETKAEAVVSTYPLATLCIGRLRSSGRLLVPAINFITDFGVHPLWVHKGIDVNLAVHAGPAEAAQRLTGKPAVACGPVVSADFARAGPARRQAARASLGLGPSDRAILIVAGSWGVGGLLATWRAVSESGVFTTVVVCGRDERLRRRMEQAALEGRGRTIVLGWTDRMADLMAACDALVENAGGLTSMEALAAGLPVVSFRPIAGHGRENTAAMASAGVSRLARDEKALLEALDLLTTEGPARRKQVSAGRAMFVADGAGLVLEALPEEAVVPLRPQRRPARVAGRVAAAGAASVALVWGGLTVGVNVAAAAAGAGVAQPAPGSPPAVYVGVRLDEAEMGDPAVLDAIKQLNASAVVDLETARGDPQAVRNLAASGIDIESGGDGLVDSGLAGTTLPWTQAHEDADSVPALSALTGRSVRFLVLGRGINAFDLMQAADVHATVVMPDVVLAAAKPAPSASSLTVKARTIYLVNGLDAGPSQLLPLLVELQEAIDTAGLSAEPLAYLHP